MFLFKGGGDTINKEIRLLNLHQNLWITNLLAKLLRKDSYWIEQASFGLSLISYIYKLKPNVIFYSDGVVGQVLWYWRFISKQNYKLLLSNGNAYQIKPKRMYCDHVQQLNPRDYNRALNSGLSLEKQSLLPYAINIPKTFYRLSKSKEHI